jgi:cell division protein FtsN
MADYQRARVYEPSDEMHVFDGSEDEEDSEGSRLPLLIVIALFVLASFGGVVWLAYEKGVASGRTEPRTIFADTGPAKVAPDNQTETQTPYKGLKIYEQQAPNDGLAGTAVANAARHRAQNSPASAAPPLRAPLTDSPPAKSPSAQIASTGAPPIVPRLKPARVERAPSAAFVPQDETSTAPGAAQAPTPAPAQQQATATPPAATPAAPMAGATETSSAPDAGAPASEPAASSAETEPSAAHGPYLLQIGSYKSPVEADTAWNAFQAKHSALVGGFSTNVKPADLGDKGVWYRLRFGPFTDKDTAAAMCGRIRADGGTCIISR